MTKAKKGQFLSQVQVQKIISEALDQIPLEGKRVLVLTPDNTRSGPMALIFQILTESLLPRVKKLDYLIALGTHPALSQKEINCLYGINYARRKGRYKKITIYNHLWQKRDTFKKIGSLSAKEIEELTQGRFKQEVLVALNKLIFSYDHLILYGPVFPHEVVGFSGGHKYFFPGIAGAEVINFTHWLGALITSFEIIGKRDTPVRAVIERASELVKVPRTGISSVIEGEDQISGLFIGEVRSAWKKAVELSQERHIHWVDRPYKLVISVMPKMYNDLWTGAKGMYKVEPVVEDGGEVIIYAPHIQEVSYTHGKILERIGYHCRDYFLKQWDQFYRYPWGVLAHSTHLRGRGSFENGIEKPRIKVTLATGISKERCERLGLGYLNPKHINLKEYEGREKQGIKVIWRAGEILYRLRKDKG